ncbi:proprotein convertase P-domain-containing protein [Photobacterium kishitanii]|uniref:Peptidase M36 n=1 Tax=Photobacterium kishitanii TaxID=318456 RepID=A0A2T3KGJ7_9GAMM|nr:proprotein convertase P-domain-containing protein [Photobacterium kishitanii]PSU98069.1 peptidase M36 [Photobacterium kishitanii]
MKKNIFAMIIPSLLFTPSFVIASELYFPSQPAVISSEDDARLWVESQYPLLSGEPLTGLVFDKETESLAAKQYRFYQDIVNGKACHSTVVVDVDKKTHQVIQLFTHLKSVDQCTNAKLDQRQVQLDMMGDHADVTAARTVDAVVQVFDPDPVTQLKSSTLKYTQVLPQSVYQQHDNIEVTEINGVRYLSNSRVQMVDVKAFDIDGDNIQEADVINSQQGLTTSVNDFIYRRDIADYEAGDTAFLNTMAFYHIDQSIRYLNSLGFDLFSQPVRVDAFFGNKDNSTTYSAQNLIVFGNGMSADAEDAGVILHELAHMINYRLISNWEEGDTGAIGEGLGDYWAASYTYRNNPYYDIDTVFRWDGINTSKISTRTVNDSEAKYISGLEYPAHVVRNGSNVDQLWSTPLFSTLKAAVAEKGDIAHAEVDKIIWEGIAALGAGATMPQAAQSIIQAAHLLHPHDAYYAKTFRFYFQQHNILSNSIAYYAPQFLEKNDNHQSLTVDAYNMTHAPLGNVVIDINPSINEGYDFEKFNNHQALKVNVNLSQAPRCGERFWVDINTSINIGDSQKVQQQNTQLPFVMCKPILSLPVKDVNSLLVDAKAINDLGVVAVGEKNMSLAINSEDLLSDNFAISLDIEHPRISDLKVSIITPAGDQEIPLLVYENIKPTQFKRLLMAKYNNKLKALVGIPLKGLWQLKIIDRVPGEKGKLVSWGIANISSYQQPDSNKTDSKHEHKSQSLVTNNSKSGGSVGWISWLLMVSALFIRHFGHGKKD